MYSVIFDNKSCMEYGIVPVRRPNIPAPEEDIEEIEIPGRDGVLINRKRKYKPITIPVEFNFMSEKESWGEVYRSAKKWLAGSGKLKFSDDQEVFYKVYFCKITDSERTSKRIGRFTAEFKCKPYTYVQDGAREKETEDVKYNPYIECEPTYIITGEGLCTITVNGKVFTVNVGQKVTIDTERMLTYRNDGVISNADASGEYEDLYLMEGENEITISNGFDCKIIPNWRML